MKRRILITLFSLITATFLTSFAACGDATNHNWADTWTYGSDGHWHECNDEGCEIVKNFDEHTMVNGQCSVCGYTANNE